ncbi:MAG: PBP1A family penicillin-binding protein, partial [bacterium]|nr:PBP1A family penicillin-binding protein [bacterium]
MAREYRRRRRSDNDGEFDWEEYERSLHNRRNDSEYSSEDYEADDYEDEDYDEYEEPSRRRTQQSANQKRRKRTVKNNKKNKKQKNKKLRKRILFGLFTAVLVAVIVGTGILIGMYAAVSKEINAMNIQNLAFKENTMIYYSDEDGNVHELQQLQAETNRIWVPSEEISQYAKDAIVAIEDERFFKHHGVDLKRTTGATIKYVLAKVGIGSSNYGGSTITQQVIKNITNENEKTSGRKIKEMLRAIALEKQLSKDEILTMYLNIVYFANNCNGIEAASHVYFNKDASELTLPEAASIAGITQYPAEFDPYAHPEKNVEKRDVVLGKMLELGYIDQDEHDEAVSTKLKTNNSYRRSQGEMTSYFTDQVVNDVINDLVSVKGYSHDFATQQVFNGGLKIYSTIDTDIQDAIEDTFEDTSNFPSTGKGGQSAMVIVDPYTGAVKGLVGGLGKKEEIRGWNRATQAKRQPGSSLKPIAVYGPAIDKSKITEASIITDEEITIGSDKWKPKNSYNDFYGDMTVREAVARSSNIPAVKVLDELGIGTSYSYLQNKFHLSSLSDKDKNYSSLSLGGLTEGVSPLEMAAAYAAFVNGGKYYEPYTYTQVVDSSGTTLLQKGGNSTQALTPAAAYITADLLYAVVNSSVGTGRSAKLSDGMPTYGKTGTTDKNFDKWFVGFTPYYVGAVWYGFDSPSSISAAGVSGNPCISAWKSVMEDVHSTLSKKELEKPSGIVEEEICMDTGKLANKGCDSVTAYFVEGTQPKKNCNNKVDKTDSYNNDESSKKSTTAPTEAKKPTATSAPSSGSGSSGSNLSGGNSASGGSSSGSGL